MQKMVLSNASKRVRYLRSVIVQNQGGGDKKQGIARTVGNPLSRMSNTKLRGRTTEIVFNSSSGDHEFNSILDVNGHNVSDILVNNVFKARCWTQIVSMTIPSGYYTVETLVNTINEIIPHYVQGTNKTYFLYLTFNSSTRKISINIKKWVARKDGETTTGGNSGNNNQAYIDFTTFNSIANLLGFQAKMYYARVNDVVIDGVTLNTIDYATYNGAGYNKNDIDVTIEAPYEILLK